MTANGDELVTLKQVKDNQAFKKSILNEVTVITPVDNETPILIGNVEAGNSDHAVYIRKDGISLLNGSIDTTSFRSYASFATYLNDVSTHAPEHDGIMENLFKAFPLMQRDNSYRQKGEFSVYSELWQDSSDTEGYSSELYLFVSDVNTGYKYTNILEYLLPFNSHDLEDQSSKQILVNQNGQYEWQKMVASDEDFKAYLGIS